MNDTDVEERHEHTEHHPVHNAAVIIRWVLIAAFVAAIVIVAMDNRDEVPVGYAFGDVRAPMWIVLVAAALAGIVIGWLIKFRSRHHHTS